MQFLSGNPDLGSEAVFKSICESGRSIHIDGCSIDFILEFFGSFFIFGNDNLRMLGPVLVNMGNGFINSGNNFYCKD